MITVCVPKFIIRKFYFFSLLYVRMSGKNINFDDKKIRKNNFYKNNKINKIDDTDIDANKILEQKIY